MGTAISNARASAGRGQTGRPEQRTVLSCFVDDDPRFHAQAVRWLASIGACRGADTEIVIHHASALPADLLAQADALGVRRVRVDRFGDGPAAYCNKLQQFEALSSSDHGFVILSDVDVWHLIDPASLCMPGRIRARVVDKQNPPTEILLVLLQEAGLDEVVLDAMPAFEPGARTHRYNCNGGLYVMPRSSLQRIAAPWRAWSRYCLSRGDLLGRYLLHSDQLGFMLALIELGIELSPLPPGANFPTHLPASDYPEAPVHVSSLHYHDRVDGTGALEMSGCSWLDEVLVRVNDSLRWPDQTASLSAAS